jgi:DNA-binding MarR family transcriptional regulator
METVPVAFAEFGQTLAFTERTLSAVLHHHLAERSVAPETWYALKLIAAGGGQVARRSLIEDLEGSRGLDPDSVQALLAQLEADGLIAGEDVVELTDEGSVQFANLRDYVLGATKDLLSEFDRRDVETTVRTLKGITLRAKERPESAA